MAPPKKTKNNAATTAATAATTAASSSTTNGSNNSTTTVDELSKKDRNALTSVSKLYDEKKYKKALKEANDFLKLHPNNIDCQCFKTLIIYKLNKKEEAHDLAKSILRANLSSFTAWHTLGFLHRQDKNYAEALKCFRNASKHNKESVQILKDLSLVQIYQRDHIGLKDTYTTLLHLQPTNKGNWIGLILTNHLLGNLTKACSILTDFFDVLDQKENVGLKFTELQLYKCMILEEMGEYDQALSILKDNEKQLLDKLYVKQKIGELLLKKKQFGEAEKIFKELLKANSENYLYHQKLWEAKQIQSLDGLSEAQTKVMIELYDSLIKEYPKSMMAQKIPLKFLDANSSLFRDRLIKFAKHFLTKGIPSLFNNLKSLYGNADKVKVIEKLFLDNYQSLVDNQTLVVESSVAADAAAAVTKEPPSTFLWTLYFLTYHYDRVGNAERAFHYLDEAIKHTPTSVDLYTTKAKLLKHQGNLDAAAECYEYARKMDMADRYLNTKSTLYALRNDDIESSQKIFSYIIDKNENFLKNITDFQCQWYEKEAGLSYMRQAEYGQALKMLYYVEKHFNEFIDDQFDFHNHIQKKLTLRSYIQFLRWEDNIYKNKPYHDAAILIIKKPWTPKPESDEEKQKREKLVQQHKDSPTYDSEGNIIEFDDDPHGDRLACVSDVFVPANKFLDNLLKYNPDSIPVHEVACQVYIASKKYQLALVSLLKLKKECPENPLYHRYLVALFAAVEADKEIKDTDKQSIADQREQLLGGADVTLAQYNEKYAGAHSDSVAHRFVVGEALFAITGDKNQALAKIMDLSGAATWKNCQDNLNQIALVFGDEDAKRYREICHQRFPTAKCFKEPEVKVATPTTEPAGALETTTTETKQNGTAQ
ncbi:tetratricopeptide-like helical domain-containing protein [Heterostelium album PN500]|uniref:Tetratricopeptide-like helical domain-containing protein n=1 Tax=Heterostelium pallidum (strain ATCC 26659 / Pp 5 / PN500) TaxID=670386 RepID=D3BCZ2_HETP5|nr:tetratricopeptide-like helical domain-containing protein [Heterostelium album PN500]EFA80784.1 tetratricopeptide-like helical domain-containing protein [Heterostelium album PN500]|eukprot:XP_020432903.1 tetratricopeptide-like helical domain-containing protein [Heterostelium album PN500]